MFNLNINKELELKTRLVLENLLAVNVLNNIEQFLPSIRLVSQNLSEIIKPLFFKVGANEHTLEEYNFFKFLIADFLPTSSQLGRFETNTVRDKLDLEVEKQIAGQLLDCLANPAANNVYTNLRCYILFSAYINEIRPYNENDAYWDRIFSHSNTVDNHFILNQIKNTYAALSVDELFGVNRGRKQIPFRQALKTTSFGTFNEGDKGLLPDAMQQRITDLQQYKLPAHLAGKTSFFAKTKGYKANEIAASKNYPLISSTSGSMVHFFAVAAPFIKNNLDWQNYFLVCIAVLISAGHHSLVECIVVGQLFSPLKLAEKDNSYFGLIPQEYQGLFQDLLNLTAFYQIKELWPEPQEYDFDNKINNLLIPSQSGRF